MTVQDLNFFDKFGKNLNFLYDNVDSIWKGRIFFKNISVYLFDNENLFILEETAPDTYRFPTLSPNQSLVFSWEDSENNDEIFLYDVIRDNTLLENFINKTDESSFAHSDFSNSLAPLDLKIPLQVNIAFSPLTEVAYERKLLLKFIDGATETVIAQFDVYGEGIEEEDRFKAWAQNFGIRFLREDANILKEYDIKEAYPDMAALNTARKNLLVNKEEIYPYIGTYKGLINFINILGYRDLLKVKEYWKNINTTSAYFDKLAMIDITDYLDDGKIQSLDLVDKNSNLKSGKQFKKTEFLALVYEFTAVTGNFDDDGIPIVAETTDFTVDEIFYKLNLLNKKLKNEILPINVKIKDIIGEFIYFQKLTINYWPDSTEIRDYQINENVNIVLYPGESTNLVLRSLDPLYRPVDPNGVDFAITRFNDSSKNPFENSQYYAKTEIPGITDYITEFYDNIRDQRFPNLNARLSWEFGDDPQKVIGAPTVLTADIAKLTLSDVRGVRLDDLDAIAVGLNPYWTLENIDFKNYYEINWKITKPGPNPYNFEYRGKVVDLHNLPHFFPYAGKYRVTIELFDFYGNVSVFSRFIEVTSQMKPEIVAFSRLEDKFEYTVKNLSNIQLQDFGASPIYYPKVNILDNESSAIKINLFKTLTEWGSFFSNRYGMGQNIYDVDLFDVDTSAYVAYTDPLQNHPRKRYWGLGENDTPITLKDFRDIEVGSLYWMRLNSLVHVDDFEAGFYFYTPTVGDTISLSLFTPYVIPAFTSLDDLCVTLNASTHPGISLFTYSVLNGTDIHAQARFLSKELYHTIQYSGATITGDSYTYFTPKKVFSQSLINYLVANYPSFEEENLFVFAKTGDVLSGNMQNPNFWVDDYWYFDNDIQYGFIPTTIDQNVFNINDIKLFKDTFTVPENGIVFFVINNLDGKNDFIWSLTNTITGEEVIRVKSVPFFIWKFKDIGNFSLKVTVIDNRETLYENSVQNFIRVLNKNQYTIEIEERLNTRKNYLIKNYTT
ncbi:hypothetical protein UFOVP972_330 [uncultured Caudovirales phage]|uniref:Uncharacterized protein n=1 Tax=uncultured Caudovirales phage TaxID=2100421 RepID=A0A6J5PZX8_9CAUD|nr:hypothetical protein UFOVP972_330 [uncultured Caudovirales phage]